jgi:hypothetical protein
MQKMIPEELVKDLQVLKDNGLQFDMVEEGLRIYIVFKNYPLPPGIYNIESADLMIFTTSQYPNAGFDMFWIDENLLLRSTNGAPRAAEQFENYMGRRWRRFSIHPYSKKAWNPASDSVISFMSYIEQRLRKGD